MSATNNPQDATRPAAVIGELSLRLLNVGEARHRERIWYSHRARMERIERERADRLEAENRALRGRIAELEQRAALNLTPQEVPVGSDAADLLEQVVCSHTAARAATDVETSAAHTVTGIHAWLAYRLLIALHQADPHLLDRTVGSADEQIENGDHIEWAWDEAIAAGHDPQKWRDEHEARLKSQAARSA